jgi:hypothetical protein
MTLRDRAVHGGPRSGQVHPRPYRRGAFGAHKKWVLTSAANLGNAFGTAIRGGTIELHVRPQDVVRLRVQGGSRNEFSTGREASGIAWHISFS